MVNDVSRCGPQRPEQPRESGSCGPKKSYRLPLTIRLVEHRPEELHHPDWLVGGFEARHHPTAEFEVAAHRSIDDGNRAAMHRVGAVPAGRMRLRRCDVDCRIESFNIQISSETRRCFVEEGLTPRLTSRASSLATPECCKAICKALSAKTLP